MMQTTIDLEQYFERDIVEFLDKQRELQDSEDKHTVSEMLAALQVNNISLASKLIEESVQNYNKLGTDNIYKEIQFKKIVEMYMQAVEFIKLHPQPSKLKQNIDLLSNSGQLEQGPIEKITAFEEKLNRLEEIKLNAAKQEKEFALMLDEKIKLINEDIAKSLRKKNIRNAISGYKDLRSLFEQYPSTEMEQKQEVYNDLLSFFMQINKLKDELNEDKQKLARDIKELKLTTKSNTDKYLRLDDIKLIINKIKEDVKQGNFNSATQKIMDLKQMTSHIPDQYKHIRTILNSKINILTQRVEFVKRTYNNNIKN